MLEREEWGMGMIVTLGKRKERKAGHSPSEKGELGGREQKEGVRMREKSVQALA